VVFKNCRLLSCYGAKVFLFYILINAKTFQGDFGRWWLSMDEGEICGDIEDIRKEIHLFLLREEKT
jgi:hypothetical protein